MDHNTIIEEYTDYLVSNIAYNMVVALTTIEDLEVYQIWVVTNPYGFTHSFDNKDEAIKFVESIEKMLWKIYSTSGKLIK